MKWSIELRGHTATLDITSSGQSHVATLTSTEYGSEDVENFTFDGKNMKGRVELDGIEANVTAQVRLDGNIAGHIRAGWFFSADFVGTPVE